MRNGILRLDEKSADDFWRLRIALFEELGEVGKNEDVAKLRAATKHYYLTHINRDLICWGVFQNEKLAAVGSLCLFTRIPYKENPSGTEGYILNIYTSPQYRERGFANKLLDCIFDYSKKNNIKRLWLNSSDKGRELYSKRGFVKKENEMELFL